MSGVLGCLRLVRTLAVETNENWMEANRYIYMDDLRERKKIALPSRTTSSMATPFC
ncbi:MULTISPECIES: hypothetical protein [unclassified Mesorhizobium]|uniref:hypothetical protein n=1 Tax=unclassified Mesorhizobium TaxID=325217 RepID=UPI001674E026|nr:MULTISPECIES: hypothetical protein [unclassified Mesorhizobium]